MTRFQDFWAVNWQDGMLVTAEHLTLGQQYVENVARRTLRTLMLDYGLAWDPADPKPETSLSWDVRMVDETVLEVEVTSCRAVTRDGSFIAIFREAGEEAPSYMARKTLPDNSRTRLAVYVTASPEKYHEINIEDHNAEPGRRLFRIPKYEVVIAGSELAGTNSLKIGEVVVEEGKVRKANIIPACLNMRCDEKQVTAAAFFEKQLKILMEYAMEFYARLMNNKGPMGLIDPSSELAVSMAKVSAHLAIFIGESIDRYSNAIKIGSPREFVIYFKELFRRFDINIKALGSERAQEIFDLWANHCEQVFRQNTFQENLRKLLETNFEPGSVHWFIVIITSLLNVLLRVFKILLDRPWGSWVDSRQPQRQSIFLWDVKPGSSTNKGYKPAPPQRGTPPFRRREP